MTGTIIAIGGGGFSEGTEPALDTYVLEQAQTKRPHIGFVASASGDAEGYIRKFYDRFGELNCIPDHLPLFRNTPDIREWCMRQDVIYVGGGNTRSMLALWYAWNLPDGLREAAANGTILSGISAGAICWFQQGVTDSFAGELRPIECLGFLEGSCCPHYALEKDRKPSYERMIREDQISNGIAIDDGAAAHYVNGELHAAVSAADSAGLYSVRKVSEAGVETEALSVDMLDR